MAFVASLEMKDDLHPLWSIPVGDHGELKKNGGYGWNPNANIVIGWSLDKVVADGLDITDRTGTLWRLTAIPLRDELFNRLVAIVVEKAKSAKFWREPSPA